MPLIQLRLAATRQGFVSFSLKGEGMSYFGCIRRSKILAPARSRVGLAPSREEREG